MSDRPTATLTGDAAGGTPRDAADGTPRDAAGKAPRGADAWRRHPAVSDLLGGLSLALGDTLRSVVLYGPAARGDREPRDEELHVLIVLGDLRLATLAAAGPSLSRWTARGRAMPRLFTPISLHQAADAFPIELGDIAERHLVLHGRDPLAAMPRLGGEALRLQCERELREKLMRFQEAYALSRGRDGDLVRLIVDSYPAFALVFRGCLRLQGVAAAPETSLGAAEAFCRAAGIDPTPFAEADELRRGGRIGSVRDLFERYHAAVERAVDAVDRFAPRDRSDPHQRRSES